VECSRLFLARLLFAWVLVVGHGILLRNFLRCKCLSWLESEDASRRVHLRGKRFHTKFVPCEERRCRAISDRPPIDVKNRSAVAGPK
jgi:hypothetical protein